MPRFHHHDREFEIDDVWWRDAGMNAWWSVLSPRVPGFFDDLVEDLKKGGGQ